MFMCRWVREFLDDQNQGLDHLIEYLSFRLVMMRHEQRISESRNSSEERLASNMTAGGSSASGIFLKPARGIRSTELPSLHRFIS